MMIASAPDPREREGEAATDKLLLQYWSAGYLPGVGGGAGILYEQQDDYTYESVRGHALREEEGSYMKIEW